MSDNKIRDELLNLLYPKNDEKKIVYMRTKSRKHTVKFIELEKLQYYNKKIFTFQLLKGSLHLIVQRTKQLLI